MAGLKAKIFLLRDRVTQVAEGFQTGLFVYGEGGVGKSFTVLSHLRRLKTAHRLYNSRMTGLGLFRVLAAYPDSVLVLEDMERLTRDCDAQGVLRSALWAHPGDDRVITWTTGTGGEVRAAFRGGIVMISNGPLSDLPELRALATRITVMQLNVSLEEMTALLRSLAARGFTRGGKKLLEPEVCRQVVDHLLDECRAAGCRPDLRLLDNSYMDYLVWAADRTRCSWRDLIASRVREAAHHFRDAMQVTGTEARKAARRRVVRQVCAAVPGDVEEQARRYSEQTGYSRADFERRRREVASGEFDDKEE
jgi:hypothetical protein